MIDVCTIRELLWLAYEFVVHTARHKLGLLPNTWVVQEFSAHRGFSVNAADVLDRMCRLLEAASASRMTMFELMELLDQTTLHMLFVPSTPNDTLLFPTIVDLLTQRGVHFKHSTHVVRLVVDSDTPTVVSGVLCSSGVTIHGSRYLFAVPLTNMVPLFKQTQLFPDYTQRIQSRVKLSSYELYPTIVFHWNSDNREGLSPGVWGFPVGPWGVISMNMDGFFDQGIISVTLSISEGLVDGYTTLEFQRTFSDVVFADEIFRQLQLCYGNTLPRYDEFVFSKTDDSGHVNSFASTPWNTPLTNLFSIGHHNEVALYPANTIESATETAIRFITEYHPADIHIPPLQTHTRRLSTFYYYPRKMLHFLVETVVFIWKRSNTLYLPRIVVETILFPWRIFLGPEKEQRWVPPQHQYRIN
jgi:hypothetical protein